MKTLRQMVDELDDHSVLSIVPTVFLSKIYGPSHMSATKNHILHVYYKDRMTEYCPLSDELLDSDLSDVTGILKHVAACKMLYEFATDDFIGFPFLVRTGWEGSDASLHISLEEYGFAWKKNNDGRTSFLYKIDDGLNLATSTFGLANIAKDTKVMKNWEYLNREDNLRSMLNSYGISKEDFIAMPFGRSVEMMYRYWGFRNVFLSNPYPITILCNENTPQTLRRK